MIKGTRAHLRIISDQKVSLYQVSTMHRVASREETHKQTNTHTDISSWSEPQTRPIFFSKIGINSMVVQPNPNQSFETGQYPHRFTIGIAINHEIRILEM
jgi:hypothetical protein